MKWYVQVIDETGEFAIGLFDSREEAEGCAANYVKENDLPKEQVQVRVINPK